MCGCAQHHDKNAACTCICEEHGNFAMARKMAFDRYDEIVLLRKKIRDLEAALTELKPKRRWGW